MKARSEQARCRDSCTLAAAIMCGVPLSMIACDDTRSSTTKESERVVDTPEGQKKVTEKTTTTTTTDDKN